MNYACGYVHNMENNKVTIVTEDGEKISLEVIERAKLSGINYLLVCDEETDEAYIMKEVRDENSDVIMEFVEDDEELKAVGGYFDSLLDDIEIK